MRIAFLTSSFGHGDGWGCYAYELVRRLPKHGVKPVVLTTRASRPASPPGLEVHPLLVSAKARRHIQPVAALQESARTRWLLKEVDIVHSLVEPLFISGACLAGLRRAFIGTMHGTYALSVLQDRWAFAYRLAYRRADLLFSVSRFTRSRVVAELPWVADRARVVPLGVNVPDARPVGPRAAEREPAFLAVGHVKPRKGTLEGIEALGHVVRAYPDARFYIAGSQDDHSYVKLVKERIVSLGLTKHVVWLGRVSEETLAAYLHRVRGLLVPSMNVGKSFEGFGLVHLEAQSFGVPSIGSLDCGNEDALAHERTGFLVEQGDVSSIAKAMCRLLGSDDRWDEMSLNARTYAAEMDWEQVASQYVRAYREVLEGRRKGAASR